MLRFNVFSTLNLVGGVVPIALGLLFHAAYVRLGRRTELMAFANMVLCSGLACLFMFMADNAVPEGVPAASLPDAAARTAFWARAAYLAALASMPCIYHFAVSFGRCGGRWHKGVPWAYIAAALLAPMLFTPWFFQARTGPNSPFSNWMHTAPWWPDPGPLLGVFILLWVCNYGVCIALLSRRCGGAWDPPCLVRLGLIMWAGGGALDMIAVAAGYAGAAVFPAFEVVCMGIMAYALLHPEKATQSWAPCPREDVSDAAAQIQKRLVPDQAPAVDGFDIAMLNRPARNVGGDLLDFPQLADGRFLIAVADATGHGLGPALVAAQLHALLHAVALRSDSVPHVLAEARRLLADSLPANVFVTCFVGLLDAENGELLYCSAGQAPLFHYRDAAGRVTIEPATEPPLLSWRVDGVDPERRLKLEPGDAFVIATDGFWNAPNGRGEPFGFARMARCIQSAAQQPAGQVLTELEAAVREFTGVTSPADDMTAIILHRLPVESDADEEAAEAELALSAGR